MKRILLIGLSLFVSTSVSANAECQVVRGVFDIGSGNTKAKVALVDRCLQKIIKDLSIKENSEKVAYKDALKNAESFGPSVTIHGLTVIEGLKFRTESDPTIVEELKKINQTKIQWAGIATSAFRKATNSAEVLKKFSDTTGVAMTIIPQKDEALYGYIAGLSCAKNPKLATVWDIGTGSQQITSSEKTSIMLEDKASEFAKNLVLKDVLHSDAKTPNPIGIDNIGASVVTIRNALADDTLASLGIILSKRISCPTEI